MKFEKNVRKSKLKKVNAKDRSKFREVKVVEKSK